MKSEYSNSNNSSATVKWAQGVDCLELLLTPQTSHDATIYN